MKNSDQTRSSTLSTPPTASKSQRWAARNPEYVAERNRLKRERVRVHTARLAVLKDVPCADCGGKFPPECMDFDHVRGEKLFLVGSAGQRSIEDVDAEIAKCDVICANCHRTRTKKRRQQ